MSNTIEKLALPSDKQSRPIRSLAAALAADQYAGYAYAYPHKTSYRRIEPARPVAEAWREEETSRLLLYLHLPFCEMRCGFCNLFTASQPEASFVDETLAAIERQSALLAEAIGPQRIVQLAVGGGTPTYLNVEELHRMLQMLRRDWPLDSRDLPFSVEVSPATIDREKLSLLRQHGVGRISMGVQSFVQHDLNELGRPQSNAQVEQAITEIRDSGIPIFNLDLIYGNQQQTEDDWINTLEQALAYRPEELFIYPLYVRSLTGLGRTGRSPAENRRHLYRVGRDRLLANGYRQISMRMFRRHDVEYATQHCCQDDGMIGLGPGARSYTRTLHYSTDYAVSGRGVRAIIQNFQRRSDQQHCQIDYGTMLNAEEQMRRYLIRSLLQADGLDRTAFTQRFGLAVEAALSQCEDLIELGLADMTPDHLRLNERGLAVSDVIGPWLYSESVLSRMESFELT